VARNQVKRRLRELVRLQILPTGILADVVLRIKPEAYRASFESLTMDILHALGELKRWHEKLEMFVSVAEQCVIIKSNDVP
jgi:ribonuclease P protein component